jgi:hypothetical protein
MPTTRVSKGEEIVSDGAEGFDAGLRNRTASTDRLLAAVVPFAMRGHLIVVILSPHLELPDRVMQGKSKVGEFVGHRHRDSRGHGPG